MWQETADYKGEVIEREARRTPQGAHNGPLFLTGFQGSLCGRLEWSWQSAAPRLRHLRVVSLDTPKRLASTPLGSLERAISTRTAGVVRALGWMLGIKISSAERAWHDAQSARRIPQSPNEPDPKNVPPPNICLGHER